MTPAQSAPAFTQSSRSWRQPSLGRSTGEAVARMSKWRRLQRRAPDLRGKMSENHICVDCGVDTATGMPNRMEAEKEYAKRGKCQFRYGAESEMYMVHDHVWKAAGMEPYGGCLCIGCLEKR